MKKSIDKFPFNEKNPFMEKAISDAGGINRLIRKWSKEKSIELKSDLLAVLRISIICLN